MSDENVKEMPLNSERFNNGLLNIAKNYLDFLATQQIHVRSNDEKILWDQTVNYLLSQKSAYLMNTHTPINIKDINMQEIVEKANELIKARRDFFK